MVVSGTQTMQQALDTGYRVKAGMQCLGTSGKGDGKV
jgi:hypothetical protein